MRTEDLVTELSRLNREVGELSSNLSTLKDAMCNLEQGMRHIDATIANKIGELSRSVDKVKENQTMTEMTKTKAAGILIGASTVLALAGHQTLETVWSIVVELMKRSHE